MSQQAVPVVKEGPKAAGPIIQCTGSLGGHQYCCEINRRFAIGIVSLISSVAMLILASLFAGGVWGLGNTGFIAGGLSIGSMITLGIAAVCLIPKEEELV